MSFLEPLDLPYTMFPVKKIRKSNIPPKCTRVTYKPIEIYLSLFENFRQNVDGENSQKWLICDGSVDYKWAENLESFMTSGVLTIHSGEELTISPHTKLIFETTHLRDVSTSHTIALLFIRHSRSQNGILPF